VELRKHRPIGPSRPVAQQRAAVEVIGRIDTDQVEQRRADVIGCRRRPLSGDEARVPEPREAAARMAAGAAQRHRTDAADELAVGHVAGLLRPFDDEFGGRQVRPVVEGIGPGAEEARDGCAAEIPAGEAFPAGSTSC
jgi:hypothetical protein